MVNSDYRYRVILDDCQEVENLTHEETLNYLVTHESISIVPMGVTFYRVCWQDGTVQENLTHEESQSLIEARPGDWAAVQFMNHGSDCHPDNEKRRREAWGAKKRK